MSERETNRIENKTTKPSGAVPKNVQAWLMVGIAAVMVLVIWISGGTKKPAPKLPDIPQASTSVGGESKLGEIEELERRIAEQQKLNATLADQQKQLGQPVSPQSTGTAGPAPAEDPVEADKKKRNYLSSYESNVALSYRPELQQDRASLPSLTNADTSSAASSIAPLTPEQLAALQPVLSGSIQSAKPEVSPQKTEHKTTTTLNSAQGKDYVLFEGNVLETVLMNRLNGDFSGPVNCMVTTAVYSLDRQRLLIPAGSKVLGEARKVEGLGQTRLAIVFHRLIMPDGFSVDLDKFHGLNQSGETGLKDQVNNHYLRIFGASLAIGAIGGLAEAGTHGASLGAGQSATDAYRQGIATSLSQASLQILDKFLNQLPTVTIREGNRVKIYLTDDLLLPDYNQHSMASNL